MDRTGLVPFFPPGIDIYTYVNQVSKDLSSLVRSSSSTGFSNIGIVCIDVSRLGALEFLSMRAFFLFYWTKTL